MRQHGEHEGAKIKDEKKYIYIVFEYNRTNLRFFNYEVKKHLS